jgi:3-methyladenine DNA glycosylase AlkD
MEHGRLNKNIRNRLESEKITSTEIRTIAKEIGKDHELADDLWTAKDTNHRMLAVLVMDRKQISSDYLAVFMGDIERRDRQDMSKLSNWLLAN